MIISKEFILNSLKNYKNRYLDDGVKIIGFFGSYAREDAKDSSDIDILIETTPLFLKKYRGLKAINRLTFIKNELQSKFGKRVDLVDKSALLKNNNLYILESAIYV